MGELWGVERSRYNLSTDLKEVREQGWKGGGEHCRQLKQTIATASLRITKEATVFIKQREWGREETGVRVGGRSCKGTTSNSADSGLYPE